MKNNFIKIISISLVILTLLASCSNNKFTDEKSDMKSLSDNIGDTSLKLAYSKGDSLNPFICETVNNNNLIKLVYDGLFKLDKYYEPTPVVAQTGIISDRMINVTLADVKFSDGSQVTANDVAYSFEQAKESENYKNLLSNILSCSISASNILLFTLENSDPYALSCLTFPIVKVGLEKELPIGCGRYYFQKKGEDIYLIINNHNSYFNPIQKTVLLEGIRDSESIESSIEIGNTAVYYDDLSDGVYSRLNANTVEMGLNSMVFIGLNEENSIFSNVDLRKAVNYCIDRSKIVTTAFQNHARITYTPFNPDWYVIKDDDFTIKQNTEKSKELINSSTIDITDRELSLIVCEDNSFKIEAADFVKNNLENIGFSVEIKQYSKDYFLEMVRIGGYDLYIGEMILNPNMDLMPIFDDEVKLGINKDSETVKRYSSFRSNNSEIMDFINTFNEDVPFIPLCYRNACVSYTNSLKCDYSCNDFDLFYDIETWKLD